MPADSDVPDQATTTRLTQMIDRAAAGNRDAADELLPLVYAELRKLASARMSALPPGQTLQPTALVHEVFARLIGKADPGWNGRGHFFGAAALAMRNILVEQARRKASIKHGGQRQRQVLDDDVAALQAIEPPEEDLLALDAALDELRAEHPRQTETVMLRYFAGLSIEATAEVMNVSPSTVERDWRFARAWLHGAMQSRAGASDEGTRAED